MTSKHIDPVNNKHLNCSQPLRIHYNSCGTCPIIASVVIVCDVKRVTLKNTTFLIFCMLYKDTTCRIKAHLFLWDCDLEDLYPYFTL